MSDVSDLMWRGTAPFWVAPPPPPASEFTRCMLCQSLIAKDQVFLHEGWHKSLRDAILNAGVVGPQGPPGLPATVVLAGDPTFNSEEVLAIKHQIDGLYILLGEDPPFNVGAPDDNA